MSNLRNSSHSGQFIWSLLLKPKSSVCLTITISVIVLLFCELSWIWLTCGPVSPPWSSCFESDALCCMVLSCVILCRQNVWMTLPSTSSDRCISPGVFVSWCPTWGELWGRFNLWSFCWSDIHRLSHSSHTWENAGQDVFCVSRYVFWWWMLLESIETLNHHDNFET